MLLKLYLRGKKKKLIRKLDIGKYQLFIFLRNIDGGERVQIGAVYRVEGWSAGQA
jgi:hypothetical protein